MKFDIPKSVKLLLSCGYNQQELAKQLSCSQSSVSYLLHGKHSVLNPSVRIVDGLKKLLAQKGLQEPWQ